MLCCCCCSLLLLLLLLQDDLIEALRSEGRKQAMNRANHNSKSRGGARSGGWSEEVGGEDTAQGADMTAGAAALSLCGCVLWCCAPTQLYVGALLGRAAARAGGRCAGCRHCRVGAVA